MDTYWAESVKEMLDLLGGDAAHQQRVLSGDLASIRAALKDTRFETMEQRELATIVATAVTGLRGRDAKA